MASEGEDRTFQPSQPPKKTMGCGYAVGKVREEAGTQSSVANPPANRLALVVVFPQVRSIHRFGKKEVSNKE